MRARESTRANGVAQGPGQTCQPAPRLCLQSVGTSWLREAGAVRDSDEVKYEGEFKQNHCCVVSQVEIGEIKFT